MPASSKRLQIQQLILPLAAFIAVLPLILQGPSCGHDFDFHLASWIDAANQFKQLNLHPEWAFSAAWNAGEPRFIFYPPLSWTLGGILTLLFPLKWVPIVYTWTALTASGFSMFHLSRRFAPPSASLLASTFYLANPYMLFTAYERTAYAELLAAAWIPLLLEALLNKQLSPGRIALPVALLWLTNAPAAVMSCYLLALLTTIRCLQARPSTSAAPSTHLTQNKWLIDYSRLRRDALLATAGTALGLGLSAFYLIPAAYERRYVQIAMAVLPGLRIQDNTLFHHTGDPDRDAVIKTASLLAILLFALTAAAILTARKHPDYRALSPSFLASSFTIAFLITPASLPLWHHLPELAFLQFPWRILALLTPILSLAIALALTLSPVPSGPFDSSKPLLARTPPGLLRRAILPLALGCSLTLPAWELFHQICDPPLYQQFTALHSSVGSEPTDEYTPVAADNDALQHSNPPYWLSSSAQSSPPPTTQAGSAPTHLQLASPSPQFLILNLRDYPSWILTLNHSQVPAHEQRDDGLLAIAVPKGWSDISIAWHTLPDHSVGLLVSALSAAILLRASQRRRSVIIKP